MKFKRATTYPSASGKKRMGVWKRQMRTLEERGLARRNAQGKLVTTSDARIRRSQIVLKKIALPLIDVFCPQLAGSKKREIIRKLVDGMDEVQFIGRMDESPIIARTHGLKISIALGANMFKRAKPGTMGQEFIHALEDRVKGEVMAARLSLPIVSTL